MKIKKLVTLAMLLAIAVVFGYVEAIMPISIGIPGVKLGLANIVTFIILYIYSEKEGMLVGILRILIVGFMFSNFSMIIYSMSGFVISFICMVICKKTQIFSDVFVSVAGGVMHNITQLVVAGVITKLVFPLLTYVPVLLISGFLAGLVIGVVGKNCIPIIKKISKE